MLLIISIVTLQIMGEQSMIKFKFNQLTKLYIICRIKICGNCMGIKIKIDMV